MGKTAQQHNILYISSIGDISTVTVQLGAAKHLTRPLTKPNLTFKKIKDQNYVLVLFGLELVLGLGLGLWLEIWTRLEEG